MPSIWIDRPNQLTEFCAELRGELIAVHTESDHFHAYQPRVCLIQLADGQNDALIDPLRLGNTGLTALFELLEDPKTPTLLHAARNDILELQRDFGVRISNIFDTQIAAKFLGYKRNGLSWLQKNILAKTPPRQFQRYDWRTRPIPAEVCTYAAAYVTDLVALYERVVPELKANGWLDPFYQQCAYVAASSQYEESPFEPDRWWRVLKKARPRLDGPGRAALRELFLA